MNAPYVDNSYKWAGGGFISTASDVVRFGHQVALTDFLKAETRHEMFQPQELTSGKSTNYGIGWSSGTDGAGRAWIGHSGGSVGGTTLFKVFPDQGVVVCVIANLSSASLGTIDRDIAANFIAALPGE